MPQFDTRMASDLLSVILGVRKLPPPVSRLAYHALFSAGRVHGADIVLGDVDKHCHATEPELTQRTLCMVHDQSMLKCVKFEIDAFGFVCTTHA